MDAAINWSQILMLAIPVILIQIGLQIYALIDLSRTSKVRWNNKWIWVAIIVLGEIIGPLVYFLAAKQEE